MRNLHQVDHLLFEFKKSFIMRLARLFHHWHLSVSNRQLANLALIPLVTITTFQTRPGQVCLLHLSHINFNPFLSCFHFMYFSFEVEFIFHCKWLPTLFPHAWLILDSHKNTYNTLYHTFMFENYKFSYCCPFYGLAF